MLGRVNRVASSGRARAPKILAGRHQAGRPTPDARERELGGAGGRAEEEIDPPARLMGPPGPWESWAGPSLAGQLVCLPMARLALPRAKASLEHSRGPSLGE